MNRTSAQNIVWINTRIPISEILLWLMVVNRKVYSRDLIYQRNIVEAFQLVFLGAGISLDD